MTYISPNSGEECTAAQLIAEIMVTREIKKKGITPPLKFWNLDTWKKKYKQQIIAANSLLKVYEPAAILLALKRKECSWQYSLRAEGIVDACQQEQDRFASQKEAIQETKEISVNDANEFRAVQSGKQSLKSKLD